MFVILCYRQSTLNNVVTASSQLGAGYDAVFNKQMPSRKTLWMILERDFGCTVLIITEQLY